MLWVVSILLGISIYYLRRLVKIAEQMNGVLWREFTAPRLAHLRQESDEPS
jgi:hypothetical protein